MSEERLSAVRTLHLERYEDVSGVSGVGIVAYGVEFPDGSVVLRWDTAVRSTVFYDSIQDVETITGHGGRTRIVFEPADLSEARAEIARLRMFERKVTHGLPGAWILTAEEHDRVYGLLDAAERAAGGGAEDVQAILDAFRHGGMSEGKALYEMANLCAAAQAEGAGLREALREFLREGDEVLGFPPMDDSPEGGPIYVLWDRLKALASDSARGGPYLIPVSPGVFFSGRTVEQIKADIKAKNDGPFTITVFQEVEELDPPGRGYRSDWRARCDELGQNAYGATPAEALQRLSGFMWPDSIPAPEPDRAD